MTNKKRLSQYWKPVCILMIALIYASMIPVSPVAAAFEAAPVLDPSLYGQSIPDDGLIEADPAKTAGQSIHRAIGCTQADLTAAINAANANPDHTFIELPPGCTYQVSTIDNVDPVFRYNGFPLITSKITINGNGAKFTGAKPDIRPFQVGVGGELILNHVEFYGLKHSEQASSIVNKGILQVNYSSFYNNQGQGRA